MCPPTCSAQQLPQPASCSPYLDRAQKAWVNATEAREGQMQMRRERRERAREGQAGGAGGEGGVRGGGEGEAEGMASVLGRIVRAPLLVHRCACGGR